MLVAVHGGAGGETGAGGVSLDAGERTDGMRAWTRRGRELVRLAPIIEWI